MFLSIVFRHILVLLLLLSASVCRADSTKEALLDISGSLYYLTNNEIYKTVLPDIDKSRLVYTHRSVSGGSADISGLSCGPHGTLLFHTTRVIMSSTTSLPGFEATIAQYDVKSGMLTDILKLPNVIVKSPVMSPDERQLAAMSGTAFIVKDLKKDRITRFDQFSNLGRIFSPTSWSPDAKTLAVTVLGFPSPKKEIYLLDVGKKAFNRWEGAGMDAHFSPDGSRVAYLSSDGRKLLVSDRGGFTLQSLDGYPFCRIDGWIDQNRILVTVAVGTLVRPYMNGIAVADLRKGNVCEIGVRTSGEIGGVCLVKGTNGGALK